MPKSRLKAVAEPVVTAARPRVLRVRNLAQAVLTLFGATPLPPKNNPQRNLGRMLVDGQTVLVVVDSPSRPTTALSLQRAQAQRDGSAAYWDRLVVLGWAFDAAIGPAIAALNDPRLEVRAIPSGLFKQIMDSGDPESLQGRVRINCRQTLILKQVTRTQFAPSAPELLIVTLDNYILLSPHAIKLDDANRSKLNTVLCKRPLSLIEYWAVDPDYDGQTFRPVWRDYRGNHEKNGHAHRVLTQAVLSLPPQPGARRVCVRAVDMFGHETEAEVTVAQPSTAQQSGLERPFAHPG